MARNDIKGMRELQQLFQTLGKVPQTVATRSARAGGAIALKAAKRNAPVDTGELKGAIAMQRERRRIPSKAVYDVQIDPQKVDTFRRSTKSGLRRKGGRGPDANNMVKGGYFYPASQEYGFLTVDGRYVPGYRYLRRAIDDNKVQIEKKILETTGKEVDKALRKRGKT